MSAPTTDGKLSLPLELAEHLQAGLPVVVSDLPSLRVFVQHPSGRPGVRARCAGLVRRGGPRGARRSGGDTVAQHHRQLLEELSWERQSEGLLQLYRDISGLVPTPRPELGWGLAALDDEPPSGKPVTRRAVKNDGVPWRRLSDTRVRVGFGSANYAGQLAALAQAATAADSDVSAEVITRNMTWSLGYPSDVYVEGNQLGNLTVQLELVRRVLPRYTHLLADAFLPIFGYLNGFDIAGDLPALTRAG